MKTKLLSVLLALFLFTSCSKEDLSLQDEENNLVFQTSTNEQTELENQLLDLVNAHRTAMGLNALAFEGNSYYFAKEHNDHMIAKGKVSHDNFSKRAEAISKKTGAKNVAENVAHDYDTINQAMEAWLQSPKHRKNLEGNYSHSAISIKANDQGELFFTHIFVR